MLCGIASSERRKKQQNSIQSDQKIAIELTTSGPLHMNTLVKFYIFRKKTFHIAQSNLEQGVKHPNRVHSFIL